jgi:hypothetical protein
MTIENNEKPLGAVSATEVDAVSCSVPADQLSHDDAKCSGIDHEWPTMWESGDTCRCGAFYLFTNGAKCWISGARPSASFKATDWLLGMNARPADFAKTDSGTE